MKTTKNQKSGFRIFIVAFLTALGISAHASAQSGGFYVGVSGGAQYTKARYAKTVDNTNAPVDFLEKGNIYSTSDSAAKTGFGGGILVGYRLNLDSSGTFYLGLEADGNLHGGTTEGTLPGNGRSEGRNQRGEAWPDKWSMERKNSYGATLLLGTSPPSLASLLGPAGGMYVLAGVRRVNAEFSIDYHGCFDGRNLCGHGGGEFEEGSDSLDETFNAFTFGAGIEKTAGGRAGIRGEVRHTLYGEQERDTFSGETNIAVPISLDGSETGFSVKAVVYF